MADPETELPSRRRPRRRAMGIQELDDDLLREVLRAVSVRAGSFAHAAVCRHWHELSHDVQACVVVRPRDSITAAAPQAAPPAAPSPLASNSAGTTTLGSGHSRAHSPFPAAMRRPASSSSAAVRGYTTSERSSPRGSISWGSDTEKPDLPGSVAEPREAPGEQEVLQQIQALHGLTSLTVLPGALRSLTNCFLRGIGPDVGRRLQRLEILDVVSWAPCEVGDGSRNWDGGCRAHDANLTMNLQVLLENCPKLTSLIMPCLVGEYALPQCLSSFTNLQSLVLNPWTWASRGHYSNTKQGQRLAQQSRSTLIAFPEKLGQLRSLRQLCFRCDRLDTLPDSITRLSSLTELSMTFAHLKNIPQDLGNLQSLATLMVRSNALNYLPESFACLTSLRRVVLHCYGLMRLPDSWERLTKLEHLELECPRLQSIPLLRLPSLSTLVLTWCSALTRLGSALQALSGLQIFRITSCRKLEWLPEDWGASGQSLKELHLKGDPSLLALPDSMGQLRALEVLTLEDMHSLIWIPEHVGALPKLRELSVGYCDRLEHLPEALGNLQTLTTLEVKCCQSLVHIPESIGNLSCLKRLVVQWLPSTRYLPQRLTEMTALQELQIDFCSHVHIPEKLVELPHLVPASRDSLGYAIQQHRSRVNRGTTCTTCCSSSHAL